MDKGILLTLVGLLVLLILMAAIGDGDDDIGGGLRP